MSLTYGDLCGREWSAPGDGILPRLSAGHTCRRLTGHASEHVCSCGARLDNLDDLAEVPD